MQLLQEPLEYVKSNQKVFELIKLIVDMSFSTEVHPESVNKRWLSLDAEASKSAKEIWNDFFENNLERKPARKLLAHEVYGEDLVLRCYNWHLSKVLNQPIICKWVEYTQGNANIHARIDGNFLSVANA